MGRTIIWRAGLCGWLVWVVAGGAWANEDPIVWITPAEEAPGLTQQTYPSAVAGTAVSYHVFVPRAYEAQPERRFPVVYWLHGAGESHLGVGTMARWYGRAMAAGKMPPALVVFPNGLGVRMWCDSKDGRTPVETMFIDELVPLIDAGYRTIADRSGRVLEGWSMGGYGAARLGFKHHDLFATVSCLAGGPLQTNFLEDAPRVGPKNRDRIFATIFGGDEAYFLAQSPWRLAEQNAAAIRADVRLRVAIGDRDEMLANTRRFHAHLTELDIPHDYTELPGIGHSVRPALLALAEASWRFYQAACGAERR